MRIQLLLPLLSISLLSCRSMSTPRIVETDDAIRSDLLEAVTSLDGTWELQDPETPGQMIEFHVSSAGSAVREVMFPGQPHEMTNMYTLDGNSLVMTHYCAAGNQPHMRATELEDGRLAFRSDGVSDLKSADAHYMAAMTLVLVDADHIEQHWLSMSDGQEDPVMVFPLERQR